MLLWNVAWHRLVAAYQHFGSDVLLQKLVTICQPMPCNTSEKGRPQPLICILFLDTLHEVYDAVGPNGNIHDERWSEVRPRGGKELDVRVVAHSTVYHARTNSLLVYGGIVAGLARFSKLSDRMFSFQLDSRHWSEIHYPRSHLQDMHVPRERAFHTSTIIGLY